MISTTILLPFIAVLCIHSTCHSVPPIHRPSQLEIGKPQTTPFLDAVGQQQVETVRNLVASGADVNENSLSQAPPLNVAVSQDNPSLPLIIELLKGGAHIDWSAHFSAPHPDPSPESSPRRNPVGSDSDHPIVSTFPTVRMHVKMPLHIAAERGNSTLVPELYKFGAYPPSQTTTLTKQYEHIARHRVKVVHDWLASQLKHNKELEEIIRSMEISPKEEGKEYYWRVVSEIEKKQK